MKYPGIGAYTDAMASINTTVVDSVLSGGDVENNSWGMPLARSGSFAYTFKINTRSGDYAFRLFQTERKGMQTRYKAISDELAAHPNKFFVDFEYLTQGIRVEGDTFPAIRMRWADGEPLGVYIEKNLKNAQRLRVLQKNIGKLASSMENAGIAHGDIQMGNVLVQSTGAVMLVDYDGMFVPGLANMNSVEVGHPNFQHPERSQIQPFDATLDRFSFALIHTGLEALIEKPDLWATFHADSDALLFRGKDLAEPGASPLFTQLNALPVTGVFSQRLASLTAAHYAETPTVNDFLSGTNIPVGVTRTKPSSTTTKSASGATSDVPWYQESAITRTSVTGEAEAPAQGEQSIDARDIQNVFDHAGETVLLVGRVESVDTTVGSKVHPGVQFTLATEGNKSVFVNVWAEGMKNFAAAGITLDESWKSRWVIVRGTLSQVLGSPTGQHIKLIVTNPEDLKPLPSWHNAQRILKENVAAVSTQKSTFSQAPPQTQVLNNDDLVANLSGSGSKVSQKTASQSGSSTINTQSTSSPGTSGLPKDRWGNPIWVWLLPVGLFVGLALAIGIAIAIGNSSSSDSNTSNESTISTGFDRLVSSYEGTCVTRSATGVNRDVPCDSSLAKFRVVEIGTPGYVCSPGQLRQEMRPNGVLCLEPIEPVEPLEVVESVEPVALQTCVEMEYDYGPYTRCFPGERWEYSGCWSRGGAVLQQKKKGKWVTRKQNISTKDLSNCEESMPWNVKFTRKASGVGVKQYRLYLPAGGGTTGYAQNIEVTVREA